MVSHRSVSRSSPKSWWSLVLLAPAQPRCLPRRRRWHKEEVGRRKSSTSVVQPGWGWMPPVLVKGKAIYFWRDRVYAKTDFFPYINFLAFFCGRQVEQSIWLYILSSIVLTPSSVPNPWVTPTVFTCTRGTKTRRSLGKRDVSPSRWRPDGEISQWWHGFQHLTVLTSHMQVAWSEFLQVSGQ